MDILEINKKIWSSIYKTGGSNLSYPNENLVRYLYYIYPDRNFSELIVLDYGFGSGNNLQHIDHLGCNVYGTEISEHAKEMTLNKIRDDFDEKKLFILEDDGKLPYEDNFFNLVVAWQVLSYNTIDTLKTNLNEIYRTMKTGGKFIGTLHTPRDIASVNSTPTNNHPHERTLNNTIANQAGSIIISIPTEDELEKTFSQFKNVSVGYFETKLGNIVGSHWVIYGEK